MLFLIWKKYHCKYIFPFFFDWEKKTGFKVCIKDKILSSTILYALNSIIFYEKLIFLLFHNFSRHYENHPTRLTDNQFSNFFFVFQMPMIYEDISLVHLTWKWLLEMELLVDLYTECPIIGIVQDWDSDYKSARKIMEFSVWYGLSKIYQHLPLNSIVTSLCSLS